MCWWRYAPPQKKNKKIKKWLPKGEPPPFDSGVARVCLQVGVAIRASRRKQSKSFRVATYQVRGSFSETATAARHYLVRMNILARQSLDRSGFVHNVRSHLSTYR